MDIDSALFKTESQNYGPDYGKHLLEQYKLYVEMADRISSRRQTANSFFLSINTAVLAFLGLTYRLSHGEIAELSTIVVSFAGILLCYFWYRLIRSYKDLNSGKFAVIRRIELRLPAALYDAEWVGLGEGKNPKLYLPFTHIEIRIPWIFLALYVLVLTRAVYVYC